MPQQIIIPSEVLNRSFPQFNPQSAPKDNIYSHVAGRMFERWIDSINGSARSNGKNADDLIASPGYVAESILRDERFVERDLEITSQSFAWEPTISGLRFTTDDYYNNAIIYNATTGEKDYVTDSSNKVLTLATSPHWDAGDKVFLTNIQGDNKIDYAAFDLIGNTTNGLRKDWVFGRSVYQQDSIERLLDSLCDEALLVRWTSFDKYKIKSTVDADSSVDTWTTPLKANGRYFNTSFRLTHISQLFNDYRINYHFDYGSGEYKKTLFVNKSGYSSELTNGSDYKDTCKTIYDTYGIINTFEKNLDWIYDDATAELYFDKIFARFSKQRLTGSWTGWTSDYIKYEVGDQVIINNTDLIPTGLNNSAKFIIEENPCAVRPANNILSFKLLEIT